MIASSAARPPAAIKTALLVSLLLASLYFLTLGGHTSSPDEENMYYVARSLAEHGGLDVPQGPQQTTGTAPMRGRDGRYYAPYGVVPSAMAAPLYLVGGTLAGLLPYRYYDAVTRVFVTLVDPLVTAATAAILVLFALRLGYSLAVSAAIGLAFGLTTVAWPYAKYFQSEPIAGFWLLLAAYGAFMAARAESRSWPLAAGLALGLAVGTKAASAVAVPGFVIYLLLARPPSAAPSKLSAAVFVRLALFLAGLGLTGLAIAYANVARFGDPVQTGYQTITGRIWLDPGNYEGLLGLLFSPGKGLLVYAPFVLLSAVAFRTFWSRHRAEAALIAWIFGAHFVFYGLASSENIARFWHGDESWGPRYLVPVGPLLMLPAGALLASTVARTRTYSWYACSGLCALGLVVQLGGVLAYYGWYTSQTGGTEGPVADRRRWEPAMSPALAHWGMLAERAQAWRQWRPAGPSLGAGWGDTSGSSTEPLPRWTSGQAVVLVPNVGAGTLRLAMSYRETTADGSRAGDPGLIVSGRSVPRSAIRVRSAGESRSLEASFDVRADSPEPTEIVIVPEGAGSDRGKRVSDILVEDIELRVRGDRLSVTSRFVPQLPVYDDRPWSWGVRNWFVFEDRHVVDVWLWYLAQTELPQWLMGLAIPPLVGLLVSGYLLFKQMRQPEAPP